MPDKFQPVKFVHEKSASFRTYHSDGAWGMVNNHSNIQVNFYTESPQLPEAIISPLNENGFPIAHQEVYQNQKDSEEYYIVVRDFQAAVVLSVDAARQIHTMLGNFIEVTEAAKKASAELIKKENEKQG